MPIYQIINPSDACTIEAPSDKHAAAAGLALGNGAYGVVEVETGRTVLSIGLFGLPEELVKHFGPTDVKECINAMADWMASTAAEQVQVFESFIYGPPSEREAYAAGVAESGDAAKFKEQHRDLKRTSMTDIGRFADDNADYYRARIQVAGSVVVEGS